MPTKIQTEIERLFGYEKNLNLAPKELLQSVLSGLFPNLKSLGLLAIGAEGAVIKAIDARKKEYACKIAHPHFLKLTDAPVEEKSLWERLKDLPKKPLNIEEIRYGSKFEGINTSRVRWQNGVKIQSHAATISEREDLGMIIPDVCEVIESVWLAFRMPFIHGVPLLRFLAEKKDIRLSMGLYRKLLIGMEKLHNVGIIHRDLKPENIIITGNSLLNPELALVDWTQAKLLGVGLSEGKTLPGTAMGTLPYASEKLTIDGEARDASEEDDVVALGVMAYEFYTFAKVPKPENPESLLTSKEARDKYLGWLESQMHPYLVRLFHLATDEDNEDRYHKIGPMLFELEKALLRAGFYEIAEQGRDMTLPELKAEVIGLRKRIEFLEGLLRRLAEAWEN